MDRQPNVRGRRLRKATGSQEPAAMAACAVCGTAFEPLFSWHLYCSTGCKMDAYWTRRVQRKAERLIQERKP